MSGPPRRSREQTVALGLPENIRFWQVPGFAGMNQQDARTEIQDGELWWQENLIRIGPRTLRAMWDKGAALYTKANSIASFFAYNIAGQNYFAVFLLDGTAVQVAYPGGAVTTISSTANTFYKASSGQLPACVQAGSQYLLISNNNTSNDYWIWDGALLYSSGTLGPDITLTSGGAGYTSAPTVAAFGGSGSGATFTAFVANGSVTRVILDSVGTGYKPGDIVQLLFTGGGSDNGAELTATLTAGVIDSIDLLAGGSGYPNGTFSLGFSGGGGSGATGTYTVTSGIVSSIALTAGGSGYTGTPTISFPLPGSGATGHTTLTGTAVNTIVVDTAGSGYVAGTYAAAFSGGGGSGATGTYTVNGSGVVASAAVTAGGTGYTSPPSVTFPVPGSGASAQAILSAGAVSSITVVSGGTNFVGTPTITITGGGGSGAIATPNLTAGVITSVTVTNGGVGYTRTPSVQVQSGQNNAASGFATVMPFGVSGSAIETFLSRVWLTFPYQPTGISNGGAMLVSAPESLVDFATSDGGLLFINTGRFLRAQYMLLRQSSGYLYPFGDSSVDVISNVQTAGNPSTTTFTYQNADPQNGAAWRDTAQDFGRGILFANPNGVHRLYGGAVNRASSKIDNIFASAVFPPSAGAVTPSSAVADIYTKRCYLMLMTVVSPFTFANRTVMVAFDEQGWFVASQSVTLKYIGTQMVDSVMSAWGTDGNSLFPLFAAPSTALTKILSTKQFGGPEDWMGKNPLALWLRLQDKSAGQSGVALSPIVDVAGVAQQAGAGPTPLASTSVGFLISPNVTIPQGTMPLIGVPCPPVPGTAIGLTITSTSQDFLLSSISMGYEDVGAIYG